MKELEARLAAAATARGELEQQLAVSRSQLADSRALVDSTQGSIQVQLSQWKAMADEKEAQVAAKVEELRRAEAHLRQVQEGHEVALAELGAKHEQVGGARPGAGGRGAGGWQRRAWWLQQQQIHHQHAC